MTTSTVTPTPTPKVRKKNSVTAKHLYRPLKACLLRASAGSNPLVKIDLAFVQKVADEAGLEHREARGAGAGGQCALPDHG